MMRTEANEKIKFTNTEANDIKNKKLKVRFIDNDKTQMANYIKDLEKTIQINKQIMAEYFSSDPKIEMNNKKTMEKLNIENANLQTQLKKIVKERDEAQGKLLISEQIIENNKAKEFEMEKKLKDTTKKLDFTEYSLLKTQYFLNKAEILLRKPNIKEIACFLKELTGSDKILKKSNLIEEKEQLAKQLRDANKKIAELGNRCNELMAANENLNLAINEMRIGGRCSGPFDIADVSKKISILEISENSPDSAYIHKLEEKINLDNAKIQGLEQENRECYEKIAQLDITNSTLFKLNTKLSRELQNLNGIIMKENGGKYENRNKSIDLCIKPIILKKGDKETEIPISQCSEKTMSLSKNSEDNNGRKYPSFGSNEKIEEGGDHAEIAQN